MTGSSSDSPVRHLVGYCSPEHSCHCWRGKSATAVAAELAAAAGSATARQFAVEKAVGFDC